MGWIDNINEQMTITTGDGKQYTPEWLDAQITMEFNISQFNFINIPGTKVDRRQPLGNKYNLRVFFQGDNHLEVAEAFRISAGDPRAWNISHPFYGKITVQPLGLSFDFTKYNVSEITGSVMETITDENPKTSIDPTLKISADKDDLDVAVSEAFSNSIIPDSTDKNQLASAQSSYYTEASKQITGTDAEKFLNLYNAAQSAIIEATAEPFNAITKIQEFINFPPGLLYTTTQNRITMLENQFVNLNLSVADIITRNQKIVYEANAGVLIANMAIASITPQPGNYGTRNQVISAINTIIANYNLYISLLDSLQTANNGGPTSYIPDAQSITKLNDLINYTVANLFQIAISTKQERSIFIEDDSNIILLTHRFYGLDADDANIEQFILNNGIGLTEMYQIKKGRKIIYYV